MLCCEGVEILIFDDWVYVKEYCYLWLWYLNIEWIEKYMDVCFYLILFDCLINFGVWMKKELICKIIGWSCSLIFLLFVVLSFWREDWKFLRSLYEVWIFLGDDVRRNK